MRNKLLALAIAASILALAAPAAARASTAAKPLASLSFARQTIVTGTRAQLSYSTANLPQGSQIDLQVEYGALPRWTYAETFSGAAGTVALPALPAASYRFRISVLNGLDTVTTSASQILTVTPASGSSGCAICQLFGGIGGAVVSWLLGKALPWIISKLPW